MAGLMAEYIKRKNNYAMKKKKKKNKADYNVKKVAYAKYLRALARGEHDVPEVKNPDEEPEFVLKGGKWSKNNYAMKYKNNITTAGTPGTPLEPFSVPGRTEFADAGTDPTPDEQSTKPSSLSFEKKYSDGGVRLSYDYYLGENDEKIKHGKYSRNYKDGSLAAEGEFKDGQKVGEWKEYKDGKLVRTYEFGEEVDGRQKKINKVSYDEEGKPRDIDKEIADKEWKGRRNYLHTGGFGGTNRVNLAEKTDEELNKLIEDVKQKIDSGSSTAFGIDKFLEQYEAERQIRIDAGRWGGGALDEYIERIK